jgi:hypothetical protein
MMHLSSPTGLKVQSRCKIPSKGTLSFFFSSRSMILFFGKYSFRISMAYSLVLAVL